MVREITKKGKPFFQCEECLFLYKDKEWALKCQEWCSGHKSCNLEIIKHSVRG